MGLFVAEVFFFRTGAIIFWHQPTQWLVGSTVLEGQNSQPGPCSQPARQQLLAVAWVLLGGRSNGSAKVC